MRSTRPHLPAAAPASGVPAVIARLLFVCAIVIAVGACGPSEMGTEDVRTDALAPESVDTPTAPADAAGMQRHVVTFRFGEDVPAARIADITARFAALRDSIPGITAFEHGVNNSPEGLNKDITHVYLLTFADAAARDAYLPHPAHQRFVELLDGAVADVFVIDYLIEG